MYFCKYEPLYFLFLDALNINRAKNKIDMDYYSNITMNSYNILIEMWNNLLYCKIYILK